MSRQSGRPTTRDIERHYFEQFRQVYPVPDGCVEYGDKPDVLIKGEKNTGIEITRFYVEPGTALGSEQRQAPLRDAILSQAQELHLAATGKNIVLSVQFNTDVPITPARAKALPAQLAEFSEQLGPREYGDLERSQFQRSMPEILTIYLNPNGSDGAKWRTGQVHTDELMSPEGVEAIVRAKESQCTDYKPCDAHWLLIVADPMNPAQSQEIRVDGLKIASDVFDRIVVYSPTFDYIVELKP
jgi:hypothetical protein